MLILLPIFILLFAEIDQNQFLSDYWLISSEDAIIKIYYEDGEYKGKLAWYLPSDNPDKNLKYDKNNPDKSLQNRLVWDIDILWGLKWDGEKWSGGTLYDAQSGSKYSCYAEYIDQNTIKFRGYLWLSFIGKSETFRRITISEKDSIMKKNPLPKSVLR